MKKRFSKSIGIIGGAGPMASALLYTTLIELCQKQYHANDYNEFPEIILESYPFTRNNIREEILLCLNKLKSAGADLFCIASHSFHGYLPDVSSLAFVNLVDETLRVSPHRPLILAAQTTLDFKLYPGIYPPAEEQRAIQALIREIAGGLVTEAQAHMLQEMIRKLHRNLPFDGVVLACTELPLLHRKSPLSKDLPVIDAVEVLAKRLLALAAG